MKFLGKSWWNSSQIPGEIPQKILVEFLVEFFGNFRWIFLEIPIEIPRKFLRHPDGIPRKFLVKFLENSWCDSTKIPGGISRTFLLNFLGNSWWFFSGITRGIRQEFSVQFLGNSGRIPDWILGIFLVKFPWNCWSNFWRISGESLVKSLEVFQGEFLEKFSDVFFFEFLLAVYSNMTYNSRECKENQDIVCTCEGSATSPSIITIFAPWTFLTFCPNYNSVKPLVCNKVPHKSIQTHCPT